MQNIIEWWDDFNVIGTRRSEGAEGFEASRAFY